MFQKKVSSCSHMRLPVLFIVFLLATSKAIRIEWHLCC